MDRLTQWVVDAGNKMASDLVDASLCSQMGGLGGCAEFNIEDYPEVNRELVLAYVEHRMDSVEAIFLAMQIAQEQDKIADEIIEEIVNDT